MCSEILAVSCAYEEYFRFVRCLFRARLTGRVSSYVASMMGCIVHFTHYIAFLAVYLRVYSNYIISTHRLIQSFEVYGKIICFKKIGWGARLALFLYVSFCVVLFLLDNKQKQKPQTMIPSGIGFVWKFPFLLTSLHDKWLSDDLNSMIYLYFFPSWVYVIRTLEKKLVRKVFLNF